MGFEGVRLSARTAPSYVKSHVWPFLLGPSDRAIALQKPWMRVLRNSLLQPAFLNFPRFDPFAELALIMFKAMRLKAAKLAGA